MRAAGSRMWDTRVRRAPAVAMCGRDVVVADESAERPVHVRTFNGAGREPPRTLSRNGAVRVVYDSAISLTPVNANTDNSRRRDVAA
jgi:hypothetical protein